MVGPTRFELVTFCTPSKRATRLRYGPTRARLGAEVPDLLIGSGGWI